MPPSEFKDNHSNLKNAKVYNLRNPIIIVHYHVNSDIPMPIIGEAHGNAKNADQEFRGR